MIDAGISMINRAWIGNHVTDMFPLLNLLFEDGSDLGERGASNNKAKDYSWQPIYPTWLTDFTACLKS